LQNVAGDGPNEAARGGGSASHGDKSVRSAFRRQHRLIKREVVALLRDGARLASANLVVKLGENKFGSGRLAIAVPKKILKRAVDRNRVKRVIRESFRLHTARDFPVDLLVTLQSWPKAAADGGIFAMPVRRQLRQTAKQLFAGICQRFGRTVRSSPLSSG